MLILNKNNRTKNWMLENHFHFSAKLSSNAESIYVYAFPVWKMGDTITLEARISVTLETGETIVDVYDMSFRSKYAPFYLDPPYYGQLLKEIHGKIDSKLRHFGIFESESKRNGIHKRKTNRSADQDTNN